MNAAAEVPTTCRTCYWWGFSEARPSYDPTALLEEPDGRRVCWALEEAPDRELCGYSIDEVGASLLTSPTFACNEWKQQAPEGVTDAAVVDAADALGLDPNALRVAVDIVAAKKGGKQ